MCGSKGSNTVVERPADTTIDTSKQQFASGQERAKKLYRLDGENNKRRKGVVLGA